MKTILLCSFVIFTCFSISASAQDLTGQWSWNSGDGQRTFTIDLTHITKDRVQGVHCVEDFEIKISECFQLQDEYTVRLVKTAENIFQGNLMSGEGRNRLVEDIQLQYIPLENTVIFTHTKIPKGISLIPVEAILQR
ncbi:hypothetical protein [Gillisia limnaea]|uniref:Uncharacterized protein n=1 Tax=Gillisia limnaea (strain DSM 15749 / LMG 21470 / R-8282) TaxID=865937 RepID=H2BSK5_GILLR|nr:hypothetical protein [Gillisia limnaea]EHQ02552.1 hypothetical protein Gilli_1911 [Gillisia limnaea DSM 15749]